MSRRVTQRRKYTPTRQLTVRDVWGDHWRVFERRPTDYGFAIYLGKPDAPESPARGGKPEVIVTPPLAAHIRANLMRPYAYPLPIGDNARRRVRQQLGVDHRAWIDARLAWWVQRLDDLSALSAREFADRHRERAWTRWGKLSTTLVCRMRLALLGAQRRPRGWWKAPEVQTLVMSSLPITEIAKRLGISQWTVYGVRDRVRRLKGYNGRATNGRVATHGRATNGRAVQLPSMNGKGTNGKGANGRSTNERMLEHALTLVAAHENGNGRRNGNGDGNGTKPTARRATSQKRRVTPVPTRVNGKGSRIVEAVR